MDRSPRRPMAALSTETGARPAPHQMLVCQSCPHVGRECRPGLNLLIQLRGALALAGVGAEFELSGTLCVEGCQRPCTLAWRVASGETWLFGDVEDGQDIDALVAGIVRPAAAVIRTAAGAIQ
ncbi:uncharacterized protein DUF1636 [Gemmobacter caeni]|uniref:Uncharacterized protein DUF1636 n=1 Tax=Gemmobacter caeni TaxID=589035 RepID=A0A2T6AVM7_9RHOB|nr:DUF1636 family protein [Gemmobacter caeni]PTX47875.1 uncharacterized protein DUF1636 [Gemmobacter caeni]TWI97403.1 uncharacterized protein DUF1636 [Gemmobacter caeni]